MDPPREDGRRCLDTDEIAALGYVLDDKGRWYNPNVPSAAAQHSKKAVCVVATPQSD